GVVAADRGVREEEGALQEDGTRVVLIAAATTHAFFSLRPSRARVVLHSRVDQPPPFKFRYRRRDSSVRNAVRDLWVISVRYGHLAAQGRRISPPVYLLPYAPKVGQVCNYLLFLFRAAHTPVVLERGAFCRSDLSASGRPNRAASVQVQPHAVTSFLAARMAGATQPSNMRDEGRFRRFHAIALLPSKARRTHPTRIRGIFCVDKACTCISRVAYVRYDNKPMC
ncbi:unnamed protein product, partial [Ectocarpus sp. 12 AP-2014]